MSNALSTSAASAVPRGARPGGSSRRATRFSAPRGSPAASARAAAVIRESIRIPPHLSLPLLRCPTLNIAHDNQTPSQSEKAARGEKHNDDTQDRNPRTVVDSPARTAESGKGTHAAQPRTGAAPAGAAVGPSQQRISL